MFYSQIILAKKGPLAKVWLAAHGWSEKKMGGRPQIFATDIAASVDSIVHPTVPLALRVSGHLLWGVVRIYSKKVHYLLHDCNQAVLKLKLAFRNNNPTEQILVIDMDERRRRRKTNQSAEDVVPHFGEFTEGEEGPIMAGAFQVPVTWTDFAVDQDDWVPAEPGDDDEDDEDQEIGKQSSAGAGSPGISGSRSGVEGSMAAGEARPAEEEWTAFDPDDDDEEEEQEAKRAKKEDDSTVSDIEVTRAVNASINSENLQSKRPSVTEHSMEPPLTPGAPLDDDDGGFPPDSPMQMVDDEVGAPQTVPMSEDSHNLSLGLSVSRDDSVEKPNLSIGGLNMPNEDDDDSASSKKRKAEDGGDEAPKIKRRRRKQKRQIVLNEQLELTGAQIRAQLNDTSDIVRENVHPSTWVPGKPAEKRQHPNTERLYALLNYERLFTRPSLGDDGHLAPELLELWGRHTAVVVGKTFPYKLRDAEEQEMEETRGQEDEMSDEPGPMMDDDGPPLPPGDDDQSQPQEDDDNNQFPPDDNIGPVMDDEEEEEQSLPGMVDSPDSRNSTLSFSLVNDLLGHDNDEDNPRQTLGSDELASNKSKWHKHTVQVFSLLKSRMSSGKMAQDEPAEGKEATEKPAQLSYQSLSQGCTRRTAATVFLELLQLKTWDYVDLDQDESFGDITILPGVKFDEDVPTKE